jgi:hypothetical protein
MTRWGEARRVRGPLERQLGEFLRERGLVSSSI